MSYRMPVAHKGDIVLWYEGGTRDEVRSCPAIVKVADHASLRLMVFGVDRTFDVESVRHMNDPEAKEYDRLNSGGWDFKLGELPVREDLPETVIED